MQDGKKGPTRMVDYTTQKCMKDSSHATGLFRCASHVINSCRTFTWQAVQSSDTFVIFWATFLRILFILSPLFTIFLL